jgi:drug/metabolite transporter (DMT)-like permease
MTQRSGVLLMVLATLLWGATFVAIRDTVDSVSPIVLVFLRFGVAGLLYLPIIALRPRRAVRVSIEGGVITGVFTTGGYLFQAIGLETTTAGSSAFLTCAATIFAGFFAWPILKQRPHGVLVAGIALALAGAALLTLRTGFEIGTGEAWTLLGAVVYALQIVVVAIYASRADSVLLITAQSFTVALILLPFSGGAVAQAAAIEPEGWLRIGYLIVAGSMLAPLFQVLAQRVLDAGRVGLLFALEPVFALMFAIGIGNERFEWRWWIGALLILASVVMVEAHAAWRARLMASRAGRSP